MRIRFLITLYRQGLFELKSEVCQKDNMESDSAFFSTDYFDKMIVKKIDKDAGVAEFLGMGSTGAITDDVIAVQNYAIYTDHYMDLDFKNFFDSDNEMSYLSMIHVYVTSDALAWVEFSETDKTYIDYFENDLMNMVKDFEGDNVKAVVFRMFSASDFMIVVRSKRPEDAFEISTRIRKQLISKKDKREDDTACLVLYKTYTILTIQGCGISLNDSEGNNTDFAIRGRYSNKYWSDYGALNVSFDVEKDGGVETEAAGSDLDRIRMLNGRYDFVVYLSSDEFQLLLPKLFEYKRVGTYTGHLPTETDIAYSKAYKYLNALMDNGYLSYINERYLLTNQKRVDGQKLFIDEVYLSDDFSNETFLYSVLNNKCNEILNRIKCKDENGIRARCLRKCPRNSMMLASIELLGKLVDMCRNVNSLSDTRVYVVALLKQLETVVDAIDEWLSAGAKDSEDFYDIMEVYTRKAIIALEKYADLIRGNNFQTLQAPRYDIISGCSVEKVLIAYGKFMSVMMDFSINNLIHNNKVKFIPIIVPDLASDSPRVQICFKEFMKNGTSSNELTNGIPRYLMVVEGPVTEKLVEGWNIITILFHEMAHNFRFEGREARNNVIIEMMIEMVTNSIVEILFSYILSAKPDVLNEEKYKDILCKTIQKIILEEMIKYLKKEKEDKDDEESKYDKYMIYPLDVFYENFENDINALLDGIISKQSVLKDSFLDYFSVVNEYVSQDMLSVINNIFNEIDIMTKRNEEDGISDTQGIHIDKIKMWMKEFYEMLMNNIAEPGSIKRSEEDTEAFKKLVKSLHLMTMQISDKLDKYSKDEHVPEIDGNIIINHIYDALVAKIGTIEKKGGVRSRGGSTYLLAEDKDRLRMLRLLGLDEDMPENRNHFRDLFKKAVITFIYQRNYWGDIFVKQYREETADLYMCTMCDLDFESYLVLLSGMFPRHNRSGYLDAYIVRICHIIIVQWGIIESVHADVDWEAVDRRVLDEMKIAVCRLTSKSPEDTTINGMDDIARECERFLSEHSDESELKKGIAKLLSQLAGDYEQSRDSFKKRDYLVNDYLRGKEEYKEIRKMFVESDNYLIKRIVYMCNCNKAYLHSCLGASDVEICYQKEFEDFIMSMYCYEKVDCAKEGVSMNADKNI